MTTTDKIQVGDSTTNTSTNTSTTWRCPYTQPKAEQGWECPRCGRINAPWARQCDCSRSNWTITTSDWTYKPEWWKDYLTYSQADAHVYTTDANPTVGGSDYWDNINQTWSNMPNVSNKVDPNVTAHWSPTIKEQKNVEVNAQSTNTQPDIAINDFTTYRTDVPKTYTTKTVVNNDLEPLIRHFKD